MADPLADKTLWLLLFAVLTATERDFFDDVSVCVDVYDLLASHDVLDDCCRRYKPTSAFFMYMFWSTISPSLYIVIASFLGCWEVWVGRWVIGRPYSDKTVINRLGHCRTPLGNHLHNHYCTHSLRYLGRTSQVCCT